MPNALAPPPLIQVEHKSLEREAERLRKIQIGSSRPQAVEGQRNTAASDRGGAVKTTVYRVQDHEGRGPYKPGVSIKWSDPNGPILPTIFEEFGFDIASRLKPGMHHGCAFLSLEQARRWFSVGECARLASLGYLLVELEADLIVGTSASQVIVQRRRPFRRKVRALPWSSLFQQAAA